jgi:superfamily I DNA and RNA helicase
MSLEVVRGSIQNSVAINTLIESIRKLGVTGTFYAGYPIIASADSSHTISALLISPEYGLVAFVFPTAGESLEDAKDEQDQIIYLLEGNLKKHETLRKGRHLALTPNVITFYPAEELLPKEKMGDYLFSGPDTVGDVFKQCAQIDPDFYRPLCAAIQRVTTIKPLKKRDNVKKTDSKGAVLKVIEKEIANLDQWQKKAAIEVPEGPQRVRGLAGSGKTVVLALKAAYLHAQHSDWNIAVTFHTRSLLPQFMDLIERFSLEHSGDKPNWKKLKILHAWGTASEPGIYSEIAGALDVVPTNFANAKNKYGYNNAFDGICNELLSRINPDEKLDRFDAVLIDEAQDLPIPFFRLVYSATKDPKRIIWAYDELQNISNMNMPSVAELFGKDKDGVPLVSVTNRENEAQQDIILPICYRNTPWALTIAHSLGFGIYRDQGLVQLFDELALWSEIGYSVESGELDFGKQVSVKRSSGSFPAFFTDRVKPEEALQVHSFTEEQAQYEWIAGQIEHNIKVDELDPDDILVIFPDAYTAKRKFPHLSSALVRRDITSHLAGVSTSRDTFTRSDSVTASSIFRAKGNEAPMVYIVNADWCAFGYEMIKLRNILFTAITRSRAWVRICGTGEGIGLIDAEIKSVVDNSYKLNFTIPTKEELKKIRLINRDKTQEEKKTLTQASKNLKDIMSLIEKGVLDPDLLPELKALMAVANSSNSDEE